MRPVCRDVVDLDSMERTSMACPALPLCGLAVTEAERSLPDITRRLRELLNGLGLDDLESLVVRMTGAGASRALSRSRLPRNTSYSQKLGPFLSVSWVFADALPSFHPCLSLPSQLNCSGGIWLARQMRFTAHCMCLAAQGAPTAARGRTWQSWALWATAPTATSSGWAARPTRRAWPRPSRTASKCRCVSHYLHCLCCDNACTTMMGGMPQCKGVHMTLVEYCLDFSKVHWC